MLVTRKAEDEGLSGEQLQNDARRTNEKIRQATTDKYHSNDDKILLKRMSYNLDTAEHAAYAPFFGFMGAAASQIFTVLGASYGTAKASIGICSMGVMRPELIMKSTIPIIMAGIIGIYGLVVSMVLKGKIKPASKGYTLFDGFSHLAAGLTVGLCGLGAGYAIGIVGDVGVRGNAQQPRLFVGMILILIFAEVLGLYGMIVALILTTSSSS